LTARLLSALTAHPQVWSKTVFFLNYDENDGFFDHVPPPVPPVSPEMGKSTVSVTGETYKGEPVGLGPRVPMLVISPWSKGGFVNSQLFDHTSVIQFVEKRFGVAEPNITPWRRAVCGDLTTAFDFSAPDAAPQGQLPDTQDYADAALQQQALPAPQPAGLGQPRQESGIRPARNLPYAIDVTGTVRDGGFVLDIANHGSVGVALAVRTLGGGGPWFYTVEAGKRLDDRLALGASYNFEIHGPNGFLREFRDTAPYMSISADCRYDNATGELVFVVRNQGAEARELVMQARGYDVQKSRSYLLAPGSTIGNRWAIAGSGYWYDIVLRSGAGPAMSKPAGTVTAIPRWAGHNRHPQPSRPEQCRRRDNQFGKDQHHDQKLQARGALGVDHIGEGLGGGADHANLAVEQGAAFHDFILVLKPGVKAFQIGVIP